MLNAIIRFALNNRLLTLCLTALIVVWGTASLVDLSIDVFPDLNRPTVTIMTEGHGMAPEEVETLVTFPLETALNGLPGIERVRSVSGVGLSVINVEFEWGTDIYRNRQLVGEKLVLAKEQLPDDVTPVMGPVSSIMGQIQILGLSTEDGSLSPMELRTLAEWVVRPQLLTISGVAQVISMGGGLKQYQILISAEKLGRYQISLDDLDARLEHISENTTGGFLEKDNKEYLIRNLGVVYSTEDIENTVIGLHFGRPVYLKDIARVEIAPKIKRGDASLNGKPAVLITIQKQPGTDTLAITESVDKAAASISKTLPKGVTLNTDIFKQANFIETSIEGIKGKLSFGSILVVVILFLFLANMRMTVITLTAIPLSFLVTAIIFKLFGFSVNTMTLGGLAIAIGELVDDAIVDVENVFRRLRENSELEKPRPILKVVYEASSEVRNSIVLATVIIGLVFLPLLNLSGLEGRLFVPLAVAYLTALTASLVVSLTVTPVLCSYLFAHGASLKDHHETKIVTRLKEWDRRMLEWALPRPKVILMGSGGLFLLSVILVPLMGADFLPKFNEGTAMVAVIAPPGTSLTESNRLGLQAEKLLLQVPEITSVARRTGRAELDEHAEGVNVSEIDVDFKKDIERSREEILGDMREKLETIQGVGINIGQPISHRIDHLLSGVNAQIAMKIYGPDLQVLRTKAAELQDLIKSVPGLVDLQVEQQGLVSQAKIQLLREEAGRYGIGVGDLTKQLELAFSGRVVAQVREDQRVFDLFFRFDDVSRANLETMKRTPVKVMPTGDRVLLEQVADIYEADGPNQINRENGQRRIAVSANVGERDLGSVINDIQRIAGEKLELPEGYYIVYGGQFENQRSATRKIALFSILSLLAIALVLYNHFRSWMITAQIMLTIPLAFMGGIIWLFLTDRVFSVASLIGLVTLCGIASRNGIMMISHYLHLMEHEGEKFSKEMVIRGSLERLVPVLMTALTAALGILPLVFAHGEPGSEILHPVAIVIVGGLLSSTLLDFIVTPTVFYRFGEKAALKSIQPRKDIEL
jgi:CzcA family heavy metal efflux pump